jgi:hypothetical protein
LTERYSSAHLAECRSEDFWGSRLDDFDQLMYRKSGSHSKAEEVDELRSTLSTSSIDGQ